MPLTNEQRVYSDEFAYELLARMGRPREGVSVERLRALYAGWLLGFNDGVAVRNPVDP